MEEAGASDKRGQGAGAPSDGGKGPRGHSGKGWVKGGGRVVDNRTAHRQGCAPPRSENQRPPQSDQRSGARVRAPGVAAPRYQAVEDRSRGEECAEEPLQRNSQPPRRPLRHGGGKGPKSAEGAPTDRSADAANETSTEERTVPPRPANWDQVTKEAKEHRRTRQKKQPKK